jgi:TetR/AcrR family transcriptional regulator, tetracycline repressor protein
MPRIARAQDRSPLTRERIVETAIAIADSEGLEAVTIRRVATDNDVTPMALYWHFKEKGQLLDGIAESVLASIVLPAASGESWDRALYGTLHNFLDALRPHPAVAELIAMRILESEPGLELAERVLGLLSDAGFSVEQAAEISSYLLSAIITLVTAEPGPERVLAQADYDAQVRQKRAALGALDPARFPHLIASADALAMCANEESYYSRGIELLVAGTRGVLRA